MNEAAFAKFFVLVVESFGDAIGIERQSIARVKGAFADFAIPFSEDAKDSGGGLKAIQGAVAAQDQRGKVTAIGVAKAAGRNVVIRIEKSSEGSVGRVLGEQLVDGLKKALGLVERNGALAAEIGLEIGHQESGSDTFAGNVADDETEAVRAEVQEIVVVTADGASGMAVTRIVQPANRRTDLREKAALDFVGDFEFLSGAAFGIELGGGGPTLGFEGMGHFVEADDGKDVTVHVAKTRDDAAPDGRLGAEDGGVGLRWTRALLEIVFEALEAGSGVKADAALGPFLKFSYDIFSDEHDVGRTADELVFGSGWFRNDEGENRGTVGRSNSDEAFAGLQLGVVGEVKAELVNKEADATVVVAHEDVDALDAEVRRLGR